MIAQGGGEASCTQGCAGCVPQAYSQPKTVKKRERAPDRRTCKLQAACDVTEGRLGAPAWRRRPRGRPMATGPSHHPYPVRRTPRVAGLCSRGRPAPQLSRKPRGRCMLTQGARAQGGGWGGQGPCGVSSSSELPTLHVARAGSHVLGTLLALGEHLPSLRAERPGEHTSVPPPHFWPVACRWGGDELGPARPECDAGVRPASPVSQL